MGAWLTPNTRPASCVTMQNLVVLGQTVCARGELQELEALRRRPMSYSAWLIPQKHATPYVHRRLADGNVHCAGSATYQICFRLPIPNPNPNPITDPNPNPKNNNNNKTKRHRNKIQHSYI